MTKEQVEAFRKECEQIGTHTNAIVFSHLDCNGQSRTYTQGEYTSLSFLVIALLAFVQDLIWGKREKGVVPPLPKPKLLTDEN